MINKKNCEGKVRRVNSTGCEDMHLLYYKLHTTNLRILKKGNTANAITHYKGMLCIHCMSQCHTGKHQKAELDPVQCLQYSSSFTAWSLSCWQMLLSQTVTMYFDSEEKRKGLIQCAFMDTYTAKICREPNPHIIQHIIEHQLASLRNTGLISRKIHYL